MNRRRILKGAIAGLILTNIPSALFQDTNIAGGVGVISFAIGTFVAGYIAGDKAGGAICGVITNGTLLVFASILIQEGSLGGLVFLVLWLLLFVPLTLIGLLGGYVAQRTRKPPQLDSVPPSKDTPSKQRMPPRPQEMERPQFCPECGANVPSGAGFCPYCDAIL